MEDPRDAPSPTRRGSASRSCCSQSLSGPRSPSAGRPDRPRALWDGEALCEGEALLAAWRLGARALSPDPKEEEEEEDDAGGERPPLPGEGSCCPKRVQFADSLGLRLASVRHYSASEEPQVPPGVLSRLQEGAPSAPTAPVAPAFHLVQDFLGPPPEKGLGPEQRVCLERAAGSGAPQVWVLVRGPGPVSVRYTFNNWLSCMDAGPEGPGEPLGAGCSRLCFTLLAPPSLQPGGCLQFAIRNLEEGGGESWDNNGGRNYTLRCEACPTPEHDND